MKKYLVAIFVLWLPFSLAALAAIPLSLAAIFLEEVEYAKNLLRAKDKLAAAVLGWSGRYTVSAECGAQLRTGGCRFCRWICRLLDRIDPGHCAGAAHREGR